MVGTISGATTVYIGGYFEYVPGNPASMKKYYAGVAMWDGSNRYYLFTDHLGSTSVTADQYGSLYSEMRYKAWGETRFTSGTTPTMKQFTGQYAEPLLGIDYFNARWYDSYLNRWIQPDSIIPDLNNPLDFDRYQYVHSNPVNLSDPSGHMPSDGCNYEGCSSENKAQSQQVVLDALLRNPRPWNELPEGYKNILQGAGINPDIYSHSDMAGGSEVRKAYAYEDPATYISLIVGGGITKLSAPLLLKIFGIDASFCLVDVDCDEEIDGAFPKISDQLMHIFRKATGHLPDDTLANRDLLLKTISPDYFIKADQFGNYWFSRLLDDGTEVWVSVRDGIIQNGGINLNPLYH